MQDEDEEFDPDEELDPNNFVRPTQQSLDLLAGRIDRVEICQWADSTTDNSLRPEVLLAIEDRLEIDELLSLLEIVESDSFQHCLCIGSLILCFVSPEGIVATLTVHHGLSIRWDDAWGSDATLKNGRGLAEWLADRGIREVLTELEEIEKQTREYPGQLARLSASIAMPPCLISFLEPDSGWSLDDGSIERLLSVLLAEYQSEQPVILVLCDWLGELAARWPPMARLDSVPGRLLMPFAVAQIIAALEWEPLTDRQIEGAATYLTCLRPAGDVAPSTIGVLRRLAAAVQDPDTRLRIQGLVDPT